MRNEFGNIYTQTKLPLRTISASDLQRLGIPLEKGELESTFFSPSIGDFISLGSNFRLDNVTRTRGVDENFFRISEGNLYVKANLIGEFLTGYLDETLAPNASNREIFLLVQGPFNSYLKAGRFLLPFGFRLLDDTAFTRQRTGFNYTVSDLGVEVGFEPGPISLSVALSQGAQNDRPSEISSVASFVHRNFRIGGSFSHNKGEDTARTVFGAFAGLHFWKFTFLAEIDRIRDTNDITDITTNQNASLFEVDYLITKGVNFKFVYEFLDPDTDLDENEITRFSFGLEPFLTQFVQTSLFLRVNNSPPEDPLGIGDRIELVLQLHFFF